MSVKPTYEELEQKVMRLEHEAESRKRTEREALKTRDRLEQRLKERTLELEILSAKLLDVQEEERKRIAGDLHDVIGQSLSAAKFMVETALEQMAAQQNVLGVNSLRTLVPMLQKASEEVRTIVMNLRPSILDNLGILATINWFCRQFISIYANIDIEKHIDINEREVPVALKTTIFRILQEAMNNIAKHSRATIVQLYLKKDAYSIDFSVHDNGRGFDVVHLKSAEISARGFGITSMKERAELSGGLFYVESFPGKGTEIRATWPLQQIRLI